jgi:hypothetical protein
LFADFDWGVLGRQLYMAFGMEEAARILYLA